MPNVFGATPLPSAASASSASLSTTPGRLAFVCVRETAAGTAVVRLFDGTSNSGTLLVSYNLAASESARDTFSIPVQFTTGLYAERVSGTTEIVAHVA